MSHSPQMSQGEVLCCLAQYVLSSGTSKHHEVLSLFLLLVTLAFPDIFLFSFLIFIWLCQALVVTPRRFDLRCSTRDLVPWPEIETRPLHWELESSHWTTREVPFPGVWVTCRQISASSPKDCLLAVLTSAI